MNNEKTVGASIGLNIFQLILWSNANEKRNAFRIRGLRGAFAIRHFLRRYCTKCGVGSSEGDYTYSVSGSPAVATIIGYNGAGGNITIPSTLGGYTVVAIGDWAFQNCYSLTSVTIDGNITSIGSHAFDGCSSLTSVTFGSRITSIGSYAFSNCNSLMSMTIPSKVKSIAEGSFSYSSLASITIPNGVTSIGDYAFQYCSYLSSVTIPNSVTSIGNYSFLVCTSLSSVTISSSVIRIGDVAFRECTSLTSIDVNPNNPTYASIDGVLYNKNLTTLIQCPGGEAGALTIPNSVTSFGNNAFYNCSSLTSATIPRSAMSIGNDAFHNCTSLTSITFLGFIAPTTVGADWILNVPSGIEGHAYASSDFPAPGNYFHGLMMGDVITVAPVAPSAPTNLTATPANAQVVLAWNTPADDGGSAITGYKLYRSTTSGGAYALVASPSGLNYTDTGLTNGQTYEYKVAASNSVGWGPNSSSISVTPQGPPSTPSGLTVSHGNEFIYLNWTAPSYTGPGTLIYHLFRDGMEVWNGTATTHNDTGLINGQGYEFKVAASNSVGWGDNSTSVQATPTAVTPGDNTLLYLGIGLIAILALAGGAFVILRKRK